MSSPRQYQLSSGSPSGRFQANHSPPSPSPRLYTSMQSARAPPKQLSVTQIHLNRAHTLKALEGHQEDIARKTKEGTIQRNETWKWLRGLGYRGPVLKYNPPTRRTKTFEEFGFNDSWIMFEIDEDTGILKYVWKGKIPDTGGSI